MHVKFIARGTGSAAAAVDYLLGERDAAGELREGVDVLRGDPEMVAAVADTLEFEHKYTSGVIAWAPEDRPTDAQIESVLDKFEQTAWAGLEPDRYSWTAVEHRERGGGVHVHVLAARCDLETGKSLNIAPPGWQQTFAPLRDGFNHEHGWSRPDDPARARTQQPGHRAYVEAATLRTGLEHEAEPRELIRDYLVQRVENGAVQSRADVVSALEEAGLEVPRQGASYVTAREPDSGKRWRLKGALYEHDFEPERLDREATPEAGNRADGDREDGFARAAEAWRELEDGAASDAQHSIEDDMAASTGRMHVLLMRAWLRPLVMGLSLFLGISGGSWATMHWLSASIESRIRTVAVLNVNIKQARETLAQLEETTWGVTLRKIDGAAVRGDAGSRAGQSALESGRAACRDAVERVKELYDRIRTAADGGLAEVVRAVRDGTAAAHRAGRSLAAACRAAGRAERNLAAANRAAFRACDRLGRGLQDDRRDVARVVELMHRHAQQRARERDSGPSR